MSLGCLVLRFAKNQLGFAQYALEPCQPRVPDLGSWARRSSTPSDAKKHQNYFEELFGSALLSQMMTKTNKVSTCSSFCLPFPFINKSLVFLNNLMDIPP